MLREDDVLLSTKEAAKYIHMSESWLHKKAIYGNGMPFIKAGNKRIYKKSDLDEWLEKRLVTSASEYEAKKNQGYFDKQYQEGKTWE